MYWVEAYVRIRYPFRSAERWYREYQRAWHDTEHGSDAAANTAYGRRVTATWGLMARAPDAVPFVLEMLDSRNPEIRADAAPILARARDDPATVRALLRVLETEKEHEPLDTAVGALGWLRAREAIPALTRLLRDESVDGDTRFGAADALDRIVDGGFDPDHLIDDALAWLDRNDH